MISEPRRLLIMACSQRKRSVPDLLPAIERYNGPQFQILRKYLREHPEKIGSLTVYILSAKFGLIPANRSIPYYDYKMTPERAHELHSEVWHNFKNILQDDRYDELFISLGRNYLQALSDYERLALPNLKITVAKGSQGRRQAELHDWLYRELPEQSCSLARSFKGDKVRIRGVEITFTSEEILDVARKSLKENQSNSTSYQAWYVLVDNQRVGPKWLVSQLTGLPVNSFHTDDAKRVLQQLGIEVRRI